MFNTYVVSNFTKYIEGKEDEQYRIEATSIADRIINYIDSTQNLHGIGLVYDYRRGLSLTDIIPEHPKLWLKFLSQVGFGNKFMGTQAGHSIEVALPTKTRLTAIGKSTSPNRASINPTVGKFLSKPDNYETLVHEIIHYLYKIKIGRTKINANYPKDDDPKYWGKYFNHPSELNAFTQSFIVRINRIGMRDWDTIMKTLHNEDWFQELTDEFKKHVIKRIYSWLNLK